MPNAALAESLVVTNLVYLAAALLAMQRGFLLLGLMFLVVFTASNAYHGSDHSCCRLWDVCSSGVAFGAMLGLSASRMTPLAIVSLFVLGPVSLHLFLEDTHGDYSCARTSANHSAWHLVSGTGALLAIASIR